MMFVRALTDISSWFDQISQNFLFRSPKTLINKNTTTQNEQSDFYSKIDHSHLFDEAFHQIETPSAIWRDHSGLQFTPVALLTTITGCGESVGYFPPEYKKPSKDGGVDAKDGGSDAGSNKDAGMGKDAGSSKDAGASKDAGNNPINHPPVLNPIGSKTALENSLLTFTISGSDSDSDKLTYSASGLPTGASFNTSTRTFSWTPNKDGSFGGITFKVSDGELSDSETINITVKNVVADKDGDGFKEDVDCDDNNPLIHPLPDNGIINKSMSLCEDTYKDFRIYISGNNIAVSSQGFGVFLTGGDSAIFIQKLTNSSVSGIHVLQSSGIDPSGSGLFFSTIEIHDSTSNIFSSLTGDCNNIPIPACMGAFLNNSKNNIIQNSVFSHANTGILFSIGSNNNTVKNCTFSDNESDYPNDGKNTFSMNKSF